ncbi:MAG: NAD(P)-dependent oxidoreductase [Lachnospiraceae bacterium]
MEHENQRFFPLFINICEKQILIVGAGKVALRRITSLRSFGASIRVITKDIPKETYSEMNQLCHRGEIRLQKKDFTESDLTEGIDMVIAATDNTSLNEWIYLLCKERGILVNVASNHSLCDFYFPAIIQTDHVVVGITGNGSNHTQVAQAANNIRKSLHLQEDGVL